MKTLSLLRHAKSSWDDPTQRDFDRPLNARGELAAHTMGAWLAREGLVFDALTASSARRVKDTLAHLAKGYGGPLTAAAQAARFDRRIYMASAACLFDVVRETADTVGHLLLVGHNPGLEDLLLLATRPNGGSALRQAAAEKYPTATFATLAFDVATWSAAEEGTASLCRFIRPRDLDPALGPES